MAARKERIMFIAEELFEKAEKEMKESNYQYNLIYGKMLNGKYYVRPFSWEGEWKGSFVDESPVLVSGNVLYTAETEEKAKEYIDVHNLLRFIEAREELNRGKELKVYRMDDYEWWVSDKTEEETIEAFVEEYGEESRSNVGDIRECNLESEGMFWDFENPYVNDLIKNILGGQSQREVKIGDLEAIVAYIEGYCVYIPFKKAIQLEEYTKPHMISGTEY